MKDHTSRFLKCLALVLIGFPVTYLTAVAVLFDIPLSKFGGILLSPLYFFLSLAAMAAGYGLWEMRRWAWYLVFGVCLLAAIENAVLIHSYGESANKVLAYLASLVCIAGLMQRISKEVRVPYFFPKIRWWENNPRYKLSVPVRVARVSVARLGEPAPLLEGEILDLSMGGCFVKLRTELAQNETVSLSFKVFGFVVECEGAVVWRTQSRVTHPRGVGIKFAPATRAQRRVLKQITGRLRKIAQLYRRSRYIMSQDEFLRRLDELERRGVQDSA